MNSLMKTVFHCACKRGHFTVNNLSPSNSEKQPLKCNVNVATYIYITRFSDMNICSMSQSCSLTVRLYSSHL